MIEVWAVGRELKSESVEEVNMEGHVGNHCMEWI